MCTYADLSESLLLHTQSMDINVDSNQTFDHVASLNTSELLLIGGVCPIIHALAHILQIERPETTQVTPGAPYPVRQTERQESDFHDPEEPPSYASLEDISAKVPKSSPNRNGVTSYISGASDRVAVERGTSEESDDYRPPPPSYEMAVNFRDEYSVTDSQPTSVWYWSTGLDEQKSQRKIVNSFLPINFSICFGCSNEPSHWDGSFEYPEHMFWLRNKKTIFQLHHS